MKSRSLFVRSSTRISLGLVTLLGISLVGCMSTTERRQANFKEDANTCSNFGARYGSPAYNDCMIAQQRRRDQKQLDELARTRLTTEIAREAQLIADRARKQRCDRNPDRRECRR